MRWVFIFGFSPSRSHLLRPYKAIEVLGALGPRLERGLPARGSGSGGWLRADGAVAAVATGDATHSGPLFAYVSSLVGLRSPLGHISPALFSTSLAKAGLLAAYFSSALVPLGSQPSSDCILKRRSGTELQLHLPEPFLSSKSLKTSSFAWILKDSPVRRSHSCFGRREAWPRRCRRGPFRHLRCREVRCGAYHTLASASEAPLSAEALAASEVLCPLPLELSDVPHSATASEQLPPGAGLVECPRPVLRQRAARSGEIFRALADLVWDTKPKSQVVELRSPSSVQESAKEGDSAGLTRVLGLKCL